MRALVLSSDGRLAPGDRAEPDRADECLIRVTLAGICGTDLELVRGYAGFSGVPGHEFVGLVERAPAAHRRLVGRRVVGEINVGCGECERCKGGVREHCASRTVLGIRGRDGAFAEFVMLPAENLHVLPHTVDDRAGVFVEPVAAACRILEQVSLGPTSRVAILGDGRLGLLVAQVIAAEGPAVSVVGRHASKLAVARTLGLDARSGASGVPAGAFDVVVEASGRSEGLTDALRLVRPRGIVVVKTTCREPAALPTNPIVIDEVTVIGSRCGPFDRAIDRLADGRVTTAPLITGVYALADFEQAFEAARTGLKALLDPQSPIRTRQ